MKRPKIAISIDGEALKEGAKSLVSSVTMIDNRGFEADAINIDFDDSAGLVEMPKTGVEIEVSLGYEGLGMVDLGTFIADSVTHAGPPDIISIIGRSADFRKKFDEQKSRHFHDKRLEEIISKIAGEHGYEYRIESSLGAIHFDDLQQNDESDANLLTRLARENDAIATIKQGTLLFLKMGEGKTASGDSLPTITINRQDGDKHSFTENERDAYTGVRAKYQEIKSGKRKEVIIGDEERTKNIRKLYRTEEEAKRAAEAELKRLKRGVMSFEFELAEGNLHIIAESPLKVVGFKQEIDDEEWIATRVSHQYNDSEGLRTQIVAEVSGEAN